MAKSKFENRGLWFPGPGNYRKKPIPQLYIEDSERSSIGDISEHQSELYAETGSPGEEGIGNEHSAGSPK